MAVLAVFLAAWATMVAAPETPLGGWLRRCLVERPAAWAMRVTRGHVALAALLGVAASAVVWLGEGDGLRMASMAAPEIATWVTTFEVATYLDMVLGALAAWTGLRTGGVRGIVSAIRRPARRQRRTARPRRPRAPDNDDDPAWPIAVAA